MEVTEKEIKDFIRNDLKIILNPAIEDAEKSIKAVIDIPSSDSYGLVFSRLEKNNKLIILDDNQLITSESSSLLFKTAKKPLYILNLIADYVGDSYKLIITYNK